MRKLTLLLAIAAIAAAPSLATAKTTAKAHHAKAPKAKVMKVAEYKDPNINTWKLFGLVPSTPAPKAKKK
jgi:hypothetical protein